MRRRISPFGLLFALAASSGSAQTSGDLPDRAPTVQDQLDRWFRAAARRAPGEWGVAVADHNGRLIWGVHPTRPLVPASAVKLLTTGYARSVLGGDARKSTRVIGEGHVDTATGAWKGTWALEVNGDPSLERAGDTDPRLSDLAQQLVDRGIRRLTGPLTVASATGPADASWPASWERRHRGRLFAPLVGNLTVNGNVVALTVEPGAKLGRPPVVVQVSPTGIEAFVTIKARTVEGRRNRLGLTLAGGHYVITGTIGMRAGSRSLVRASTDPRLLLQAAWAAALAKAGIEWQPATAVSGDPGEEPTVLAEVRSATLDSLASDINRRSSNLGAELLLQWAADGDPIPADRLTAHVQQITGDYSGVRLVDGSGLSGGNRVSPQTFVSYLARFPLAPGGRQFPMLLPANGTGTLSKLATGLPQRGVVRAKTGTLGNVSSVVGYLGRQDGVLLVSVMYNGARPSDARRAQWDLFRTLGAQGVVVPADSLEQAGQLGGTTSR